MRLYLLVGLLVLGDVILIAWAFLRSAKHDASARNTYEAQRKRDVDQQIERVLYPRTAGPHGFSAQNERRHRVIPYRDKRVN